MVDNHRLAYRSESMVNWAPVWARSWPTRKSPSDGRSERGNFPVFRKPLPQWMLRITAYADRLIDDLDQIDWPDKVRTMQRNWIGRSTGAEIYFQLDKRTSPITAAGEAHRGVHHPARHASSARRTWCWRPSTRWSTRLLPPSWPEGTKESWTGGHATPAEAVAGYRQFAAGKSEIDRQAEGKAKTGVFIGTFATNPVTGARAAGVRCRLRADGLRHRRDHGGARAGRARLGVRRGFELPIVRTVQPPDGFEQGGGQAFSGEGPAINSSVDGLSLDGLGVADAKARIIEWLEQHGAGQGATTYRLRDWLFSRQRYWGEPFPIVYDEDNLPIALPDSMLPLRLPDTDDFSPKSFEPDDVDSQPEPPLGRLTDWVNVELDLGDGPKTYRRETNTMPNWAGSCWYELRYLDPTNDERFVDPLIEHYWMGPSADRPLGGVELYVGGVEHAVLHLLYARFWHKVLFDLGYLSSSEPFHRLVNQGMLQLPAYANKDGFYVEATEVVERDGEFYYGDEKVTQEFGKIGKSLKNVVTPDDFITEFGADTFRLFEMFSGPLEQSRPWDAKAIVGPYRLLQRIWRIGRRRGVRRGARLRRRDPGRAESAACTRRSLRSATA